MQPARSQRTRLGASLLAIAGSAALAGAVATSTPAAATSTAVAVYAPAATAQIHPGVQMYTDGAQCTANFVFTDASGATYVGYAAHCAGTGAATDTDGCAAGSPPLGTKVDFVEGGSLVSGGTRVGGGTLAYSSWLSMQQANETDPNTCAYNDLALVRVALQELTEPTPEQHALADWMRQHDELSS